MTAFALADSFYQAGERATAPPAPILAPGCTTPSRTCRFLKKTVNIHVYNTYTTTNALKFCKDTKPLVDVVYGI